MKGPNGRSQVRLVGALGTSPRRTNSAGSWNSNRIAVVTGRPASDTATPPLVTRTGPTWRIVGLDVRIIPSVGISIGLRGTCPRTEAWSSTAVLGQSETNTDFADPLMGSSPGKGFRTVVILTEAPRNIST